MLRYAVLIVAGCNQVYGLDPTRLPDAAPRFPVTGQLMHRWVENDPAGNPKVLEAPLTSTNDVYLSVRTGDAVLDIAVDDAGGFTFNRPSETEPYAIVLTTDGELVELQHDVPSVQYLTRSAGRIKATQVASMLNVTFPVATGSTGVVASTGVWGFVSAGAFLGNYTVDWQKAATGSARLGLVDASKGDVLYNFETAARTSPEGLGYEAIVSARRNAVTMGTTTVTLPAPIAVSPPACSKLVGPLDREANRFVPTNPLFVREYDTWGVLALPSIDAITVGAIPLASGRRYGAPAPLGVTQNIHNPIDGSSMVAVASTRLYRFAFHPGAALGLYQAEELTFAVPLDCSTATTTVVTDDVVGIPGKARLEGIPIDVDYADVPMPEERNDDLELTWDIVSPGRVDYYGIQLSEVRNAGGVTGANVVRAFQTPSSKIRIAQRGLVRGRYYVFQITALAGLPDAKSGDVGKFTFPFSSASTYTGLFRIR